MAGPPASPGVAHAVKPVEAPGDLRHRAFDVIVRQHALLAAEQRRAQPDREMVAILERVDHRRGLSRQQPGERSHVREILGRGDQAAVLPGQRLLGPSMADQGEAFAHG